VCLHVRVTTTFESSTEKVHFGMLIRLPKVDRVHAAQGQDHGINSQKTPVIKSNLFCFKGVRTTAESSCVFVNIVFVKCRNDFLIVMAHRLDIIRRSWRRLRRRLNGISIDFAYEGCRNALLNRLMVDVFYNFVCLINVTLQ